MRSKKLRISAPAVSGWSTIGQWLASEKRALRMPDASIQSAVDLAGFEALCRLSRVLGGLNVHGDRCGTTALPISDF